MNAKIVKWGNSQAVRLPKFLLESLGLAADDTVLITTENDSIVIKKANPPKAHKTIEERFAGYEGDYVPEEIDWGKPVGKEIW